MYSPYYHCYFLKSDVGLPSFVLPSLHCSSECCLSTSVLIYGYMLGLHIEQCREHWLLQSFQEKYFVTLMALRSLQVKLKKPLLSSCMYNSVSFRLVSFLLQVGLSILTVLLVLCCVNNCEQHSSGPKISWKVPSYRNLK